MSFCFKPYCLFKDSLLLELDRLSAHFEPTALASDFITAEPCFYLCYLGDDA